MKRLLLASAAAIGLAIATPSFAQITEPLPATPPVVQPTPTPDTSEAEEAEVEAQAPVIEGAAEAQTQAEASTTVEPPSVAAQASVAGEAQTPTTEPGAQPATPPVTAEAQTAVTATQPDASATAEATSPDATATEEATTSAPMATAETTAEGGATPAFASANAVCQPRTTSVHFGARGSALSRENQNAIEHAIDAASVCDMQQITIAASGEGSVSQRRAQAVRATLVRQGVPVERITISEQASADADAASTGQLDVRMQLAGVTSQAELEPTATSGRNAAADAQVQVADATPQMAPRAAPMPAPAAPEVTPTPAPTAPEVMPATPETTPEATPPTEDEEMQEPASPNT